MKPVTLHAEAEAELRAALHYYDQQRTGLGGEFLADFEAVVKRIQQNPTWYALEDDSGVRFGPLRRFPYMLVYVELEERIWIAALAHQRMRPGYWARRQPD